MRALVVAEHNGRELHVNTAKCVECARALGTDGIDLLVPAGSSAVVESGRIVAGVTRVLSIGEPRGTPLLAAVLAPQVVALAGAYTHVLGPASTFGKDLLPRVAALLGVGQLSDIMAVESAHRFKRPMYAGNAIITVEADPRRLLVATVRMASYAPAGTQSPAPVEERSLDNAPPTHTRFIELRSSDSGRVDLQTAARVVGGGRGLGSAANFKLVYELARVLGAAVAASRAAVDSGFVANDLQVGQTGKIIAPDLYIAVGVSGAIQHLTGIKDARTIVAINRDSAAPIFEVADVGLVADLFAAVPELIAALGKTSTDLS
jgi:electron transfer flavoprotein alpha subunit